MRAIRRTTSISRKLISDASDVCEAAENTSVTFTHLHSSSERQTEFNINQVCDTYAGLIWCHKRSTEILTTFGRQKATQQTARFWIAFVVNTTCLQH